MKNEGYRENSFWEIWILKRLWTQLPDFPLSVRNSKLNSTSRWSINNYGRVRISSTSSTISRCSISRLSCNFFSFCYIFFLESVFCFENFHHHSMLCIPFLACSFLKDRNYRVFYFAFNFVLDLFLARMLWFMWIFTSHPVIRTDWGVLVSDWINRVWIHLFSWIRSVVVFFSLI